MSSRNRAALPADVREALELFALHLQAEVLELDAEMVERMWEPRTPSESFERVEDWLLRRFDVFAERMFSVALGAQPDSLNFYEDALAKGCEITMGFVLNGRDELRNGELADFIANLEARLEGRAQRWVSKAMKEIVARGADAAADTLRSFTNPRPDDSPAARTPAATRWEDIHIRFVSDFLVQITVDSAVQQPLTYTELGFEDRRSKKPILAWQTLYDLGAREGVLVTSAHAKDWPKIEKRVQEIRSILRRFFQIPDDPIPYRDGGYRARFEIHLAAHLRSEHER